MMSILRPDAGKLVWAVIGAALVAYTGLGRFLPKKG
jgi:hypothetical protein